MVEKNDWRLRGQDEYMKNMKFHYAKFTHNPGKRLHTHCEFCWHKFMENSQGIDDCSSYGYSSLDGKYWVCTECFDDFKELFNWKLMV